MRVIQLTLLLLFTGAMAFGQNPLLLKDVFPGATGSGIQQIVKTGQYTFFNALDGSSAERGLYRTDGTTGSTIKLNLSFLPDPPPSANNYLSTKAEKLTALGSKLVFAGDNSTTYGEIWASDGTQAGTIAIERFQPSVGRAAVQELGVLGSVVMYTVVDNNNHTLLKKTDGTHAGTSLVYDFSSFSSPPEAVLFKVVNGILYFVVYDIGGSGRDELWRSDGTTAGTYMLYDFGLNQYVASYLMPAGNTFYVMLVVPGTGNVLWKSDGTAAGTSAVKTIGSSGNNNYPANVAIGSTLYFAGLDGNGKELWKTDGTAAGTVMLADINPGTASSNPFNLTLLNNHLYFSATTVNEGTELWKFDGVNATLVKDINPGAANSSPGSLIVSNNTIVFRATTINDGAELWITDGSSANTLQVANINPGTASSSPNLMTPGSLVYFSANNGVNGSEIHVYDNAAGINCNDLIAIPDASFEQALIDLGFDTNGLTGNIKKCDALSIIDLNVNDKNISSLAGIEYFNSLRILQCNSNNLTILNLGNKPNLTHLNCDRNAITNLIVSNCPNLVSINSWNNQLTSLDISKNLFLEELISFSNKLTTLDISLNTRLKFMNFSNNKLVSLNIANGNNINFSGPGWAGYSFYATNNPLLSCIKVDAGMVNNIPADWFKDASASYNTNCPTINCNDLITIPDANFEQALINLGFDTNGLNGNIKKCDALSITDLNVNDKTISSLSGIEHFTNLQYLYCHNNLLTTLDLGNNSKLINLHCGGNSISTIDVSKYTNLASLHIWLNQLTSLDLSQNLNLEELLCSSNKLTSLDISLNTKLKFMNFADNKLVNLNIANGNNANFSHPSWADYSFDARYNPALSCIKVDAGMIGSIPSDWFKDASASYNTNCPTINCNDVIAIPDANFEQALINLGFDTNGLNGNIKKCDALSITDLNVNDKTISSLSGIEHFTNLQYLYCHNNLLTTLDLGNNSKLINLHCGGNSISTIDVSKYTNLASLHIWLNQLTSLDLSQNLNLEELLCSSNKLTSLDISLNTKLKFMNFADNKLVNLNIANGNNANFSHPAWADYSFDARYNPALSCIKVDAGMIGSIPSDWFKDATANYSSYSCESLPIVYVNNNDQTGDVYTTAVGNNANPGTAALPFATIQYAVSRVTVGGMIYVDAGTYVNQVTIDKGITIAGAGRDLTSILKPANTVPPPGSFTEQGVIQTAQNIGDVYISNVSITGGPDVTPIILQTGGSVKNCNLQGGNQGIFFRVASATKSAEVENNIINAEYIGVNFQGSGLTATLANNEISTVNPGFSAGVFVGLDYGPIPQFTVANNKFISYSTHGIFGGSHNTNIIENSFTGNGSAAIYSFNSANATCNWFGTDDAEIIRAKITGPINYAPWLISGADINPSATGFQPAAGTCTGRQNKFYVNDNSQAGDALTSAIGNNANNGFSIAPFATINYAISVAQAGDTIVVDAGTYVENVVVNKSLTLRGVKNGQNPGASLDRGGESIIMPATANTALAGAIMQPAANNILIDGFMLDGDNPALTGGLNVNGADANIGCAIYNNGMFASNLTVKNNIVKNTAAYGIGLFRTFGGNPPGPALSTDNLFTQNRVDNCGSRGIVFGYSAYGNVTNNHISRCATSGTWFSQQSLPNTNNNPSYLTGNTVENCLLGMQSSGLQPNASAVHYLNNEITGVTSNFAGISLLINNNAGAVAANNKISGPNVGVYINATNAASPILVNNNSITSNASFAIQSVGAFAVTASCNWYGTTSRNDIAGKITGNMVNYTPWLINGTDDNPAIGFQPVANACQGQPAYYVNDNSLTGDVFTTATGSNSNSGSSASPFATVDYAVAVAQPGDTIYVDAGDYTIPTFTINKSITILGSNYQVSPNDPTDKTQYNTARNAEARITGGTMIMGADWIIMQGLRFSSNAAITLNGDYSHIKFYKNYFDVASSGNTILLQGASTSPIIAFDFALTHNRFERTDNFTGNALFLGAVKSLWIDNNVFIESGPAVNRSTGIRTATVSTVENIVVSNNYLKKLNNSIITSILNTAVITSNIFDSCAQGVNYMPTGAISSNVTISSNSFINLRQARSVLVRGGSGGGINDLNVINNTINQSVDGINGIVSMIQLEYTAANTFGITNVQNNIINISGDYNNTGVGMNNGIQLVGKHGNTTIENNEINFTAVNAGPPVVAGIFPPVPAGIFIATDGSAIYGMIPSTAVLNIRNNKIQGFKTSVAFYDPTSTGTNSNVGYGYLTNGAAVNISNNSFTADSISIDNGTVSQIVTATCNWYGSAAAQNTATKVSASSVNYTPWLTSGTDENPATGFQPIAGTCTGTPPVIAFNSSTNVSCFGGNNGSINISVTGGATPYIFNWIRNGAGGYSTIEDPANLMAGSYDLLLTDANGSTASLNALLITEPALLTATVTGSSTSCFNSASVSASGGTGSYSYLWNNGATTADISNIPPGTYSVVVTDQNNCTVTDSVMVSGNPAFNPSIAVTNVSCFGEADGSLAVTNANGVAPYQYSIDGIQFQNSNIFTGLAAGTYTLTVRDALGCTGFNSKTIAEPAPISLTLNSVQGTCFGSNTGAVSTSASGGSPAFTYQWSGPNGFTAGNSNISNLATGSYTLTVTDSKGCIATLTVSVPTTPQVLVNSAVTNVQCKGESNGSIAVTVSGGTGSFSYQWSNGANTASISNLGAGNYNLVITDDGSGCSINKSYSISQPSVAINLSTTKSNVTGCSSLGTITITGSGGTAPYLYSINGVNFVSSGSFTGLYSGTYNAWVKDASGCTKTLVVSLTDNGGDEYESNNSKNQAKAISIGIVANARLAVSNDPADWFKVVTPAGSGSYTLSLTHPTSSFTYNLYIAGNNTPALVPTSTGTTSKVYTLLGNTTYYISVTGGLSYTCYSLMLAPPTSFTLPIVSTGNAGSNSDESIAPVKNILQEVNTLSANAYPNPHRGSFNLTIASTEKGMAKIELFTINGQKLQERNLPVQVGENNIVPFTLNQHGTIFYRVQIGKQMVNGKVIGVN